MNRNYSQKCPYCGKPWNWSTYRRRDFNRTGRITVNCADCHRFFAVIDSTNKTDPTPEEAAEYLRKEAAQCSG